MNKIFKNIRKFIISRRGMMLLLLPFVVLGVIYLYGKNHTRTSYAADPLVVTYDGSGPPAPMFNVSGMLPGDEIIKDFNLKNNGGASVNVKIDGVKVSETLNYAGILDVEITDNPVAATYFSGKLQEFFDAQPISLGSLNGGADKNFRVKVKFPISAEDEYQSASVRFNILWLAEGSGSPTPTGSVTPTLSITPTPGGIVLPAECSSLSGKITKVIEGSDGDDRINGTNASELILGKNGIDRIFGLGGDDCIVGGTGDDRILSGQGNDIVVAGDGNDEVRGDDDNDIIYGGNGDDELDGGSDNDSIYGEAGNDEIDGGQENDSLEGGEGNDDIKGGSGNDNIYGNNGNDVIDGGAGEDTVYGGSGNDEIDDGSGNDQLFGEQGNDSIEGGSQNDLLNGGANTDDLDGESGTDTCTEGEVLISCEL